MPIVVLGILAASAGILVEGVHERDTEHFATQAVSQDWVTLLVAVPVVLVLGWYAYHGSLPARLMWHGAVFYFAYTHTVASFMVRFNSLFLVYTSLLACSIIALVGGLSSLGWPMGRESFGSNWPRKGTMVLLWFDVIAFALLWLSDIVPALLEGSVPESLAESDAPTNGVEVLDLALLLPTAGITAIWVRRAEPRGYLFAMGIVTYACLLGLAPAAMAIGLTVADLSTDAGIAIVFALVTITAAELLRRMLKSMSQPTA